MATEERMADRESEKGPLIRLLLAIRGSFNLFVISLGTVTVAASILLAVLDFQKGVLAALLMIWGVSAILLGVAGLAFLTLIGYR